MRALACRVGIRPIPLAPEIDQTVLGGDTRTVSSISREARFARSSIRKKTALLPLGMVAFEQVASEQRFYTLLAGSGTESQSPSGLDPCFRMRAARILDQSSASPGQNSATGAACPHEGAWSLPTLLGLSTDKHRCSRKPRNKVVCRFGGPGGDIQPSLRPRRTSFSWAYQSWVACVSRSTTRMAASNASSTLMRLTRNSSAASSSARVSSRCSDSGTRPASVLTCPLVAVPGSASWA